MSGAWRARGATPWLGAALALALGGCPQGNRNAHKPHTVRVRVRSFTEASPVRLVTTAKPYAFTASGQGLDRWDLRSGQGLHLDSSHGLPGDRVTAVAQDPARKDIWIATDGGITRYDTESETFAALPPAPQVLGLADLAGVSLAPAGDGGVWIGHPKGLFYTNQAGKWSPTPVSTPITALLRTRDGRLWIGTTHGLMVREVSGATRELGQENGCDLARVRFIAHAPDGSALVVGETLAGKQHIVLTKSGACATFRASPDLRWVSVATKNHESYILTPRQLFVMRVADARARRLTRDGMRLAPVTVGTAGRHDSPYVIEPVNVRVPGGATALAAVADDILIGTRDLGTALMGRTRHSRWLRRSVLVDGARNLSVACKARNNCYLATGSSAAWRFDGKRFEPLAAGLQVEGEQTRARVLAFVRAPSGEIYGLRESEDLRHVLVTPIRDDVWVRVSEISLDTPGGRPGVSFARFSPAGVLWVGLRYKDDSGEERPYGVALVNTSLGAVVYHHETRDRHELKEGVLPIPIHVADASFLEQEEVWLATSEGAARVKGSDVKVYTEGDGLASELLRGVACSAGGMVYVASGQGIGRFDGERWTQPPMLRFPVNDIEIGRDGRLWMATDRGVAVYDGARVRRLDVRRGLLQNEVDDIALDHFGRVWVRGSEGITVVTP